ncbi:hypothetical protein BS47DRAFT_692233 [Hydnum rufescens UP504]|uniref:Uncharacterized protein n=1 Tax=Hydnum rufescens UP504 TaxID=1448309 RepID=A0A9P6DMJ3_9AGAM|nr:hypothetical protein BS47DRAFT_692233 [Hydnum rufescens UP504]
MRVPLHHPAETTCVDAARYRESPTFCSCLRIPSKQAIRHCRIKFAHTWRGARSLGAPSTSISVGFSNCLAHTICTFRVRSNGVPFLISQQRTAAWRGSWCPTSGRIPPSPIPTEDCSSHGIKYGAWALKCPLLEVIHPPARLEGISPRRLSLVELHISRGPVPARSGQRRSAASRLRRRSDGLKTSIRLENQEMPLHSSSTQNPLL